jgi:hypothetical protein
VNSVTFPPGVTRPIRFAFGSAHHRFPSGPAVIAKPAPAVGNLTACGAASAGGAATAAAAISAVRTGQRRVGRAT